MQQKHKGKNKNILKILVASAISITLAALVTAVFLKPSAVKADSSMEINGNGVLVRYNIYDGMTQVSIPDSVKAIGNQVFMGDKSLERVYIPGSVKVIGEKAFYGCDHLLEINVQDGTETIKDSAFAMCTGMSRAILPASLRNMGNGVFAGDTALNDVTIDSGNRSFFINDNVIYNYDSTRLVEMVPGRQGSDYEMPFSVKSISPYAFWGAEDLKNVRVSNNVNAITPFAFTNASGMEFIYLPNSVTSIQEYAFRNCSNLKTVAAEGNIRYVDPSAFSGVGADLREDYGVTFAEAKEDRKKQENTGNKADKTSEGESGGKTSDKSSEKAGETLEDGEPGQVSSGGEIVFDTPWGINAPYKETDLSDPNLYGAGKIVGGKTVIIPAEKQDYSGARDLTF